MSANTPLLTEASRIATTQDVDNYSAGVAAHINGDLGRHIQVQVINANWVDGCGNVIVGSFRLRILATFQGVDVAVVLPIVLATPGGGAPSITAQPQDQTSRIGGAIGFFCGATSNPPSALHYQWRHNGIIINGAVSPTFGLTNIQPSDGGSYDCIVSNAQGQVISNAATLTVTLQIVSAHVDSGGLFGTLLDVALFGEPFGPF